jgi:hypothetical protein
MADETPEAIAAALVVGADTGDPAALAATIAAALRAAVEAERAACAAVADEVRGLAAMDLPHKTKPDERAVLLGMRFAAREIASRIHARGGERG